MVDQLVALIVEESKWLTASMAVARGAGRALLVVSRRAVGWAIVGLAVVANVALFVGSLVFLISGQSFEQFSGME